MASALKPLTISLPADVSKGIFFSLTESWILLNQDMPRRTLLGLGNALPIRCMFNVVALTYNDSRVGFVFTSAFEVVNKGGYLLTMLKNKPKAEEFDILVKDETLIIYDYPNRGTLAISPLVSDDVLNIFESQ